MLHTIAALQMTSTDNVQENLQWIEHHISHLNSDIELLVLPENFACMAKNEQDKLAIKEIYGEGIIQNTLQKWAKEANIWIVGGTLPIAVPEESSRVFATSLAINPHGEIVTRYNKIHLFDANLIEGKECYQESASTQAGKETVVISTPFGNLGLAICYDLRFPELFRELRLKGADIIALPTAFTEITGRAHWEPLIRARAIEEQCYIIAACQTGQHTNGRRTYGHSIIVDPWGKIMGVRKSEVGLLSASIDLNFVQEVRRNMRMF